jgi:hypothetical protein
MFKNNVSETISVKGGGFLLTPKGRNRSTFQNVVLKKSMRQITSKIIVMLLQIN